MASAKRRAPGSRYPQVGPIRLTPVRLLLAIALGGSALFNALAILVVRDAAQIPMLTSGLLVMGVVFAALAVGAAISMWRASQESRAGQAMLLAIGGGLCGIAAMGCLAGSVVLGLLWGG